MRALTPADQLQVAGWMIEHWGSEVMITRGAVHRMAELPGFAAVAGEQWLGLITYHIAAGACEIVTLDSAQPNAGVGMALIEAVKQAAGQAGCRRLWLITTNDNATALRFYQRRGFTLAAIHWDAVSRSRQIKPEIPLTGNDGIAIRDEIELDMTL